MAYIYKIVNRVNQKVYIGKTQGTIEERFKQHLSEYKNLDMKNVLYMML